MYTNAHDRMTFRSPRPPALNQPHSGFWRIACCEPCVVHEADGSQGGFIWNVSVVGAYVVMPLREEGQRVSISFTLPGDDDPIEAEAHVVWQNRPSVWPGCGETAVALPPGCGVRFTRLEPDDLRRIDARVRKTYPEAPAVDLSALDASGHSPR